MTDAVTGATHLLGRGGGGHGQQRGWGGRRGDAQLDGVGAGGRALPPGGGGGAEGDEDRGAAPGGHGGEGSGVRWRHATEAAGAEQASVPANPVLDRFCDARIDAVC